MSFLTTIGAKLPLPLGLVGHQGAQLRTHLNWFRVEYWKRMQAWHKTGEVVDTLPYKPSRRTVHDESAVD